MIVGQKAAHSRYHAIYLSPHLDDAALSCGGQIFLQVAQGSSVLIVTSMAGDPPAAPLSAFARYQHEQWQLDTRAVSTRRREDAAACEILGAGYQHWNVPDCIYRYHPATGEPLYTSDEAIFGAVDPAESALIAELAAILGQLPVCDAVYAPLAIGNHVDHQLVRVAAESALDPGTLYYYEDYPYVERHGAPFEALDGTPRLQRGWMSTRIDLTPAALQARIRAVSCYRSQLEALFGGRKSMEKRIATFVERAAGERIWRRDG